MNNKGGIFKIKTGLNYHWPKLKFDMLVLVFHCHLHQINVLKIFENEGEMAYQCG